MRVLRECQCGRRAVAFDDGLYSHEDVHGVEVDLVGVGQF